MNKATYNKSCLVRELGFNVGITQKKVRFLLEALQQITYREAHNQGITIPGICRLDVIQRKPRKMRNPQTGENILIAEHDTLRVRVLKKARNAVTPPPENLITILPPEGAAAPTILDDFSNAVSFCCKKCGQEIEAPLSAAGILAECPACGAQITVPSESEYGTLHKPAVSQPSAAPAAAPSPATPPSVAPSAAPSVTPPQPAAPAAAAPAAAEGPAIPKFKNQTIRIDLAALGFETTPSAAASLPKKRMLSFFCKNCRQEIEAPADMAGSASECPSCGISFEVPFFSDPGTLHGSDLEHKPAEEIKEIKSRTIRIEVPDDM